MRLRAPKFLLFSFAFTSVLTFAEALQTPEVIRNGQVTSPSTVSNSTGSRIIQNETGLPDRTEIVYHGLDKRSAEVYPEEKDQKEEGPLEKRARVGFAGMRGKKEFTPEDYCARNLRARLEGVLNKRYYKSYTDWFGDKRATLAFHGMRGKKSQDREGADGFGDLPRREFLMSSGLLDVPLEREREGEEFQEEQERPEVEMEQGEMSKRSPYAFQGMRGKKESAYELKRAMGFLGMRGKKATEVWVPEGSYKRAPQTSFFGMKGKKAQSGFFGMRGKKASPSAFFGIKGKREPLGYDFEDLSLINQMKDSASSRNNSRFRREAGWLNNSKKAKNAFFGIRGKKSTQENE